MTSERSQREKAQSSMQQEDKLKCVFLIGGESSQGLIKLHGIIFLEQQGKHFVKF